MAPSLSINSKCTANSVKKNSIPINEIWALVTNYCKQEYQRLNPWIHLSSFAFAFAVPNLEESIAFPFSAKFPIRSLPFEIWAH